MDTTPLSQATPFCDLSGPPHQTDVHLLFIYTYFTAEDTTLLEIK